ncbi:MAG: MMPL family transporter [Chitinophagaceae bacterium]|nr:MMPL family transporter [Chitinophagaceae bacterium]
MWQALGKAVLKFRIPLIIALVLLTVFMGYHASKVQMSYDFSRAIPTDHPKYKAYLEFKKTFGEDGNLLTIGFTSENFFEVNQFNALTRFQERLKKINGVEDIISVNGAVTLKKNDSTNKLDAIRIFPANINNQQALDSLKDIFYSLPFYRGLLYNPDTKAYLLGLRINSAILGSKARETTIGEIEKEAAAFAESSKLDLHLSGLPLIRTNVALRIAQEMQWFLLGSVLLSALILFIFFRSLSTTLLSLTVVLIGVVYSLATIHMLGFRITLLNALIPPLVVVIGIPNCIYFLNKYHTAFMKTGDKKKAIVEMIGKMGVVTLFCNISAALGFAVFALTKSIILKEFGIVAGINIMALFFISLILIPIALYYMAEPRKKHTRYLENKWLQTLLTTIEQWVFSNKRTVYLATGIALIFSIIGISKLKTQSFIVDDLPKKDKIYTDLRFFESNFRGIMPLEILVDTKKKNGIAGSRALSVYDKVSSFSAYIASYPEMARPLSLAEGLKFAKQGFYDGDSNNYSMPNAFDGAFMADYMKPSKGNAPAKGSLEKLMSSFIDSNKQVTRISVNMADVGSMRMPILIDSLEAHVPDYFDTSKVSVQLTGSSITFLEGSRFIIKGLKESIFWAFLFISLCMLYLFRSFRILLCSLIPNLIPLVMTAGLMGWMGIAIKPSTVLVFSVALGIAIDITIRFLVNYKQELPHFNGKVHETVVQTIRETGISIVYTSLVLIAGFIIFVFSGFGSTQALGWLTSFTLLVATLTNLILLPVLLLLAAKKKS